MTFYNILHIYKNGDLITALRKRSGIQMHWIGKWEKNNNLEVKNKENIFVFTLKQWFYTFVLPTSDIRQCYVIYISAFHFSMPVFKKLRPKKKKWLRLKCTVLTDLMKCIIHREMKDEYWFLNEIWIMRCNKVPLWNTDKRKIIWNLLGDFKDSRREHEFMMTVKKRCMEKCILLRLPCSFI